MSLPHVSTRVNDIISDDPWDNEEKIVIGIDIGTTQSGVAYAYLFKGGSQAYQRVGRWPGQTAEYELGKLPTLVLYNSERKAIAFGVEAASRQADADAEEEEDNDDNGEGEESNRGREKMFLAKNFKLHLHPENLRNEYGLKLDLLPPGVSLRQVYKDFLGYLFKHTQSFFEDHVPDGERLWKKYRLQLEVVIAHPNGWGLGEQKFLRDVAVEAGIVPASSSDKIMFVSEAEASVHYCMHGANLGANFQVNTNIAVCDAGGSTVDTTVYSVVSARPKLKLREAQPSDCVQAGGIFVNATAEAFFKSALARGSTNNRDVKYYTAQAIKDFEVQAKRRFDDSVESAIVKLGDRHCPIGSSAGVHKGKMTIKKDILRSFFDGCINDIIASVDKQVQATPVSHILLVGGFGDSPFLKRIFKDRYESQGYKVTLANDSLSKAVANGAVIWNVLKSVTGRAPRESFGTSVLHPYESSEPGFQGRKVIMHPFGMRMVPGGWSQIVTKGVVIDTSTVTRDTYAKVFASPLPNLEKFEADLYSCSKDGTPKWLKNKDDTLEEGFQSFCTINANLSGLSGALEPRIGLLGLYWSLSFDICMRFGDTELQAWIEWEEDGTTRKGKATIIPHDNLLERTS